MGVTVFSMEAALDNDIDTVAAHTFFEAMNNNDLGPFSMIADSWTFLDSTETSRGINCKTSKSQLAKNIKRNMRNIGNATFNLDTFGPSEEGFSCEGEFEQLKVVMSLKCSLSFQEGKIITVHQERRARKADDLE